MKVRTKTEEVEMIGGFRSITATEEKALSEYLRQKKRLARKRLPIHVW